MNSFLDVQPNVRGHEIGAVPAAGTS